MPAGHVKGEVVSLLWRKEAYLVKRSANVPVAVAEGLEVPS